ncbi:MAG: MGMT family protein [Agarilytica sp.]
MTTTPQESIYQILSQVPSGKVVTYGYLAKLAGLGNAARFAGTTLKKLPKDTKLPWHRVVNAQGKISFPESHPGFERQKSLLMSESVCFKKNGKVDLGIFLWEP